MKKKFSLTNDLVSIEEEPVTPKIETKKETPPAEETVTITIRVPKKYRAEIKSWCSQNNTSLVDAIKSGLSLLIETKK